LIFSGFKTKHSFDYEQQGRYKKTPDFLIKISIQKKVASGKDNLGTISKKG